MEKKERYPLRINKYLAKERKLTRRGADELVAQGRVFVNKVQAKLGEMINEGDIVDVKYKGIKQKSYVYLAYNKPRGVLTYSTTPEEKDISKNVPIKDVFPVGRLDKDSSGLIILTNDGRVTERLLHPDKHHEKEYLVTTKEKLRSNFKQKMEAGVQIESEKTRPCKVEILNENKFRVVLTEGKKHQIRRMCSALFQHVDTLKRVRIMNIRIGQLKEDQFRALQGDELQTFLRSLDLV
jgi:23S rRNA pseudouridine2604 synthase